MNNGTVSCLLCNATANYQIIPVNGVCQCMSHYVINESSICTELCGDGVIIIPHYLYCDDGNLISGDGCSYACSV
jgi:cysteine-rich repeat protein